MGGGGGNVVGAAVTVVVVVTIATVSIVVGGLSMRINVVDPVTSTVMPETFTRYSSGLNVEESTSNDQRLYPFVPGITCTVPEEPENSPLCAFCVGLNDEEMISTMSVLPTARLVEPVMVNVSPAYFFPIGLMSVAGLLTKNETVVKLSSTFWLLMEKRKPYACTEKEQQEHLEQEEKKCLKVTEK